MFSSISISVIIFISSWVRVRLGVDRNMKVSVIIRLMLLISSIVSRCCL